MKAVISFLCLLAMGFTACSAMAADPPPISIEGDWQCGPYTMETAKFTATGSNKVNYKRNKEFYDFAIMTIVMYDGIKTTLNTQTNGTWSQVGDVLITKTVKVQVLSSNNPRYPVEAAQRSANEQQAKEPITKYRIRVRNNSMTLRPVHPASKEADIDVACRRP
jgi:asparagine N-glycosylation enzyme membrane subunit Stt3